MTTLVTGGLGYIGSHIVRVLENRGEQVVVVDDFSTGDPRRVTRSPVVKVNLAGVGASDHVAAVIADHDVSAVVHLAAKKKVDESVTRPLWYYSQNLDSLINVLDAMSRTSTTQLVFSSSAAVYGSTDSMRVSESAALNPINPYGETKLMGEMIVRATAAANGIRAASLRYFNVAGAGWPDLGDSEAHNLLPITIARIVAGQRPVIFGDDYPTPDGTCLRDYIHVLDLAEAHVAAIDHLAQSVSSSIALNVGTGVGTSVRELISEICAAMDSDITPQIAARRGGDPASVVAEVSLIANTLSWRSRLGVREMVRSTLDAGGPG
jgi:UDP-glucose 4-epimerase